MDFWTALFANLPATLMALGSLIGVIMSHIKLKEVKKDVRLIEVATNSMKDALIKSTGEAAFLEGKAAERTNPEQRSKPNGPRILE